MDKRDYKKEFAELYAPKGVAEITVPKLSFAMIQGHGEPGGEEYQRSLKPLYALVFTIKMSKMGKSGPVPGYFEYVMPPLEGLWWGEGMRDWISMIRLPEFVTGETFDWAVEECRKKKDVDMSGIYMDEYDEGLCVQALHTGSYDDEDRTMGKIRDYIASHGLVADEARRHHEIYLSDPRRTAAQRLKTVLRTPVKRL